MHNIVERTKDQSSSHSKTSADGFKVIIIGAGFAGILIAIRLKQAGIDFILYEKAASVGGTWRDNTYPGVACDVPSQHYCYSFEPNPDWSHRFSPGAEIQRYIEHVAKKYGLLEHLRLSCEVCSVHWDGRRWKVRLSIGEEGEADIVVCATGVLHHPAYPTIDGLDRFEGPMFHAARWQHDVLIDSSKCVGIVGTATTAAQLLPALAESGCRLRVFQRTPNWVIPVPNKRYPDWQKHWLRRFPIFLSLAHRANFYILAKTYGEALVGLSRITGWLIRISCWLALRTVRDRELRQKLTPNYTPGCKRLVFSSRYYEAMQRPNVTLITEAIERIVPEGVRTVDGQTHRLDVLILATGFIPDAFMRPVEVVGTGGITIDTLWADGPFAYRAVGIPHMPNFFTLVGPHSPIATLSVVEVAEWQADYIMRCIQLIRQQKIALSPTIEATAKYRDELAKNAKRTVWVTGCKSWFLGKDGLPALYSLSPLRYREEMAAPPDLSDYVVEPLVERVAAH